MNDRWDSVSINLMEVLSASRNLFFSDSFDVIAVFKTIRDAQRTRNLLKFGVPFYYLQYFANVRRGIIRHIFVIVIHPNIILIAEQILYFTVFYFLLYILFISAYF